MLELKIGRAIGSGSLITFLGAASTFCREAGIDLGFEALGALLITSFDWRGIGGFSHGEGGEPSEGHGCHNMEEWVNFPWYNMTLDSY